jgi:hypothetical protein
VELLEFVIDGLVGMASVLVALPGVHGIAARSGAPAIGGFAKTCVRDAVMAPKLNEHARSANAHDPERERYVAPPRARLSKELGRPEQRVEVRGNERLQAAFHLPRESIDARVGVIHHDVP